MRDDVRRLVYDAHTYKTQEELDAYMIEHLDLEKFPITEKEIKTLKGNRIKAIKRRVTLLDSSATS
jgi:CII-binding regulator of phage lambda lysogenization HflD